MFVHSMTRQKNEMNGFCRQQRIPGSAKVRRLIVYHLSYQRLLPRQYSQVSQISLSLRSLQSATSDPIDNMDMDDFTASNNLLSVFLEYCSIIQQFSKSNTNCPIDRFTRLSLSLDEEMCNTTKLCYLILLCIAEDEFANATMHDENVIFSVYLHKAVGHRAPSTSRSIFLFSRCVIANRTMKRILRLARWRWHCSI